METLNVKKGVVYYSVVEGKIRQIRFKKVYVNLNTSKASTSYKFVVEVAGIGTIEKKPLNGAILNWRIYESKEDAMSGSNWFYVANNLYRNIAMTFGFAYEHNPFRGDYIILYKWVDGYKIEEVKLENPLSISIGVYELLEGKTEEVYEENFHKEGLYFSKEACEQDNKVDICRFEDDEEEPEEDFYEYEDLMMYAGTRGIEALGNALYKMTENGDFIPSEEFIKKLWKY